MVRKKATYPHQKPNVTRNGSLASLREFKNGCRKLSSIQSLFGDKLGTWEKTRVHTQELSSGQTQSQWGSRQGNNGEPFFNMKGNDYSLSGVRFQREQVGSSRSSGLLHVQRRRFLAVLLSPRNCPSPGRHEFYCYWLYYVFGGDVRVNLSILESPAGARLLSRP